MSDWLYRCDECGCEDGDHTQECVNKPYTYDGRDDEPRDLYDMLVRGR